MPKLSEITLEYIRFRCDVDEDTGCWVWRTNAKTIRALHPQIHVSDHPGGPRPVLVRRLAYERHYKRELKPGMYVIPSVRRCPTPGCCNPAHNRAVSYKEKVRWSLEQANDNRLKKQIANATARRKSAKLSLPVVQEIRALPRKGPHKVTDTEIVRRLQARGIQVCRKAVSEARNGTTWREYGSVFGGLVPSRSAP